MAAVHHSAVAGCSPGRLAREIVQQKVRIELGIGFSKWFPLGFLVVCSFSRLFGFLVLSWVLGCSWCFVFGASMFWWVYFYSLPWDFCVLRSFESFQAPGITHGFEV